MLSLSKSALLKLFKTTSPQKLFDNDCISLYHQTIFLANQTTNRLIWEAAEKSFFNCRAIKKGGGLKTLFRTAKVPTAIDLERRVVKGLICTAIKRRTFFAASLPNLTNSNLPRNFNYVHNCIMKLYKLNKVVTLNCT